MSCRSAEAVQGCVCTHSPDWTNGPLTGGFPEVVGPIYDEVNEIYGTDYEPLFAYAIDLTCDMAETLGHGLPVRRPARRAPLTEARGLMAAS